jgi:thiol:disulfide interchange protein
MARLQRFLAIPMTATAVACVWLLWRLEGRDAAIQGIGIAALLSVVLVAIGSLQRGGKVSEIYRTLAIGFIVTIAAVVLVPERQVASERAPSGAETWSEAAVEKYRAERRPVFVYFTADWCLTCKANEAAAIEREATQDAFKKAGVKVLVGDWTNGDPVITRFLESRGRAGVPLYLWYEPGQAEPEELPQILTPSMLTDRAQRRR